MFKISGKLPKLTMPKLLLGKQNSCKEKWIKPPALRWSDVLYLILIQLVFLLLLTSCSSLLPHVISPKNPQPPQFVEPIPQKSYSLQLEEKLRDWQKQLMGTSPTK